MADPDAKIHEYAEPDRYRNQFDEDRSLSIYEFECLIHETYSIKPLQDLETRLILLLMGRLGMRRGEFAHIQNEWIDWENKRIIIPEHHNCQRGQDGGACGDCRQKAKQRSNHNEDISFEEALQELWTPKTEAASRTIPFGFSGRAELVLEQYFEEFDHWMYSAQAINRRMNSIAEQVDVIDELDAHILRSTAASFHFGRGLDLLSLQKLMGWRHPIAVDDYIKKSTDDLEVELDSVHP